jgi:hypothetical protein
VFFYETDNYRGGFGRPLFFPADTKSATGVPAQSAKNEESCQATRSFCEGCFSVFWADARPATIDILKDQRRRVAAARIGPDVALHATAGEIS